MKNSHPIPDSSKYLIKDNSIVVHGNRLPHWNQEGKYVFFTFRLGDSLPKERHDELKSMIDVWVAKHPKPWDYNVEKEYRKLVSRKLEELIDKGYGSCILRKAEAASVVEATLRHDDGKRYELIDYVIMPNHLHVLVNLIGSTRVESIMQVWKGVSSHKLRKMFGDDWCGWMEKYHDRHIRNEEHFNFVIDYITKNYCWGGVRRKENMQGG